MAEETTTIELVGLGELMLYLRKYDPLLLAIMQEESKIKLRPLAQAVGKEFPKRPKSLNGEMNWYGQGRYKKTKTTKGNAFPKYSGDAQTRVEVTSSASVKRGFARIQQMSPSGAVFDSAKESTNISFIQALEFAVGKAPHGGGKTRSRVLYPMTKKHLPIVEKAVQEIIERLNGDIEKALVKYT